MFRLVCDANLQKNKETASPSEKNLKFFCRKTAVTKGFNGRAAKGKSKQRHKRNGRLRRDGHHFYINFNHCRIMCIA